MKLPGRFPAVEKALDGMGGDLENLKQKKLAAKESRGALEGTVTDAVQHSNEAYAIKNAMNKQQQKIRLEDVKLKTLENDAGRLDQVHDSLVASLHNMIGPKLMLSRGRLEKKEMALRKEENAAKSWEDKRANLKTNAMELIKKKKASYQSLLEAEAATAQAKKNEELARMHYEHDRKETAEQVQSYKYAETRYQAEYQREQLAKTAAEAARASASKLYTVEHLEQEKVDTSINVRRERLRRKIDKVQEARAQDKEEYSNLEHKYKEWKEQQRERSAQVLAKSQETEAASEAFQAGQQRVLESAQAKVVRDATGTGDWDAWGGSDFTKVADEEDDDN